MKMRGTISEWYDNEGYGYIAVENQQARVKFHLNDLQTFGRIPRVSERVQFKLREDTREGLKAVQIEKQMMFKFTFAIAIWFSTTLIASMFLLSYPPLLFFTYVALSAIAYLVYALDKHALRSGTWRVPSIFLFALNLFGGWPGALLAQSFLNYRHIGLIFNSFFWATLLANFGAFCWTLTSEGATEMMKLLMLFSVNL
ncbi:DUF1294 domain-containing protein [Vibrio pectenicida]|uniref:DUF1294 domain-containing protein n=2 Tax=Vibrio pectenicida TaxID=62763 RepID=A0A7Y3ZZZ4_9VIBR|nr:DUF1294 domain-containing protein [Vibrio pectenicida]